MGKKFVGPDGIPGKILKFAGVAMIPYLARLVDITTNNTAIQGAWKKRYSFSHLERGKSIDNWKL